MKNARGKLVLGEKCLDSQLSNIHNETVLAKGTFQFGSCAFPAK